MQALTSIPEGPALLQVEVTGAAPPTPLAGVSTENDGVAGGLAYPFIV